MADIYSARRRSEIMSRIRSRGNRRTEVALLQLLRKHKISGWRRHSNLPGTPDFIFVSERIAIFVDGCFWHGCPDHASFPVTRAAFWSKKLAGNKTRDRRVNRELRDKGWLVLRIWQHELRPRSLESCLTKIRHALRCARRLSSSQGLRKGQLKARSLCRKRTLPTGLIEGE